MSLKLRRRAEEALEALWTAEERGDTSFEAVGSLSHVPLTPEIIEELESASLIGRSGGRLHFTQKGKERARALIRRHRLAERLLHDVLSLSVERMETNACAFEHILAPDVTESICTLLGHPRECPHGTPIPEGHCCREARSQVKSLVVPLSELKAGESAKIAYINTKHHPRLHKLISFGVAPGSRIRCHQKYPSYIIQSENTELALEENVARDIFVWREG